ncbi:MAG: hypothetical protein ACI8W3_001427 [Myxococcota bacterium]|jgi:hypothetical protein
MSDEASGNTQPEGEAKPFVLDRERNTRNLKSVAAIHFTMLMAALTLFGASDMWAVHSGWALAEFVAISNAIIASYFILGVLHEWGHYSGARLSGSITTVAKKPVNYFFMFNFPFEHNDTRQFVWMSWGGILVPWALVVLTMLLVPIDNASRAMLLAAFVARAVQVSLFEVPTAVRARNGGDPKQELDRQIATGFEAGRYYGLAAGALVLLVV